MTRRGTVGIHELWNRPEPEISSFHITFADGFKVIHNGGLATLPRDLIAEHGNVKKAKAIVQAKHEKNVDEYCKNPEPEATA